jgi:hypothetical protein
MEGQWTMKREESGKTKFYILRSPGEKNTYVIVEARTREEAQKKAKILAGDIDSAILERQSSRVA